MANDKIRPNVSKREKQLPPRHETIGIADDISEHEDERLNPGRGDGSASGAGGGKPSAPSNSA